MNQSTRDHHKDHHDPGGNPPGWQRHSKWFVVAVVLMLIGMFVYVATLEEEVQPPNGLPGEAERMPADAE